MPDKTRQNKTTIGKTQDKTRQRRRKSKTTRRRDKARQNKTRHAHAKTTKAGYEKDKTRQ